MWAVEHWGVEPDILLTAKGIASGMPISGMIARAELLEAWGAGAHGSTYGGNPVACAAALATIQLLEGGLVANAAARGEQAMRGLREIAAAHDGFVTDVRGRGLMIGIEFDTPANAEAVEWACFQRGLLVLECGKSTLRLAPALVVDEDEVKTALRLFGEAVASVSRGEGAVSSTAQAAISAQKDPVEAAV
jgi:4-aminobutyrate aminotransferase